MTWKRIKLSNNDSAEGIRDKLESLRGDERLSFEAINGLKEYFDKISETRNVSMGGLVSVRTRFVDDQTPTGTVDGANATFTLTRAPETGSLKVYRGGARQRITEDYTFNGKTITFIIPPVVGEIILVDFRY